MGRLKREPTSNIYTDTNSAGRGTGSSDTEAPEEVPSRSPSVEYQASSGAPKRKRAKKTSYSLDAEVENGLMGWIKENQVLWNSKLIHYKRTDMKEALWAEKGQQLGKTADYLRGWWRSIKDNFTRLDKKISGDKTKKLTEREEWILKTCSFLWPLVRHKSQPSTSIRADHSRQGGDTLAQAAPEDSPSTSGTVTTSRKRKHQDDDPALQKNHCNNCKSGPSLKQSAEPANLGRRAAFANFVKDSLLTMSKPKYKVAKAAIWDTLHKLDMFDDSSSDDEEPAAPPPQPLFITKCEAQLCTPAL
ncbi:uncharacterized protein LOC144921927 [Branchiostoma floridae x Branchiostoma belcheri]